VSTRRVIEYVDTTIRDGNQSLWSATGLTTPDVLAIAPTLDRVGYRALDFTSSTHLAVSVRFHKEDPWERLRLVSAAMPNTPLGMIGTGMRFISWVPAAEDLMALSFRVAVRNGLRRFQIADPSNDPARIRPRPDPQDRGDGAAGGDRAGRGRPDVLDQPSPHA
jgi:oxaloacetate decarboxylase (Na+ extruding) subunit alpha